MFPLTKSGNRIKEKISKFVDKVKSKQAKKKKLKKKEQDLLQRALTARRPAVIEDDGGSSRECSIRSNIDTDNVSKPQKMYLSNFLILYFPMFPSVQLRLCVYMYLKDSDMDVCPTSFQVQEDRMEFKLSYEMWRVGKWAVQVRNVRHISDQ